MTLWLGSIHSNLLYYCHLKKGRWQYSRWWPPRNTNGVGEPGKGFMNPGVKGEKSESNEAIGQTLGVDEGEGQCTDCAFLSAHPPRSYSPGSRGQERWESERLAGDQETRREASDPLPSLFRHVNPSRSISNNPLPTTFLWLYNTVFPRILWHFIKATRRWYCPFSKSEINSSFIASGNAVAAVRTFDRFSQLQDLRSILYLHLHEAQYSRCSSCLLLYLMHLFALNDQFVIFLLLFLLTSFFLHFVSLFAVWFREWCISRTNLHYLWKKRRGGNLTRVYKEKRSQLKFKSESIFHRGIYCWYKVHFANAVFINVTWHMLNFFLMG